MKSRQSCMAPTSGNGHAILMPFGSRRVAIGMALERLISWARGFVRSSKRTASSQASPFETARPSFGPDLSGPFSRADPVGLLSRIMLCDAVPWSKRRLEDGYSLACSDPSQRTAHCLSRHSFPETRETECLSWWETNYSSHKKYCRLLRVVAVVLQRLSLQGAYLTVLDPHTLRTIDPRSKQDLFSTVWHLGMKQFFSSPQNSSEALSHSFSFGTWH